MDLDISDILASVTRANPGTLGTHANGNLLGNSSQQQADLQDLTRAWISERVAPELLHYPTDLMERTMRRLRQQVGPINPNTRITNPKYWPQTNIVPSRTERLRPLKTALHEWTLEHPLD